MASHGGRLVCGGEAIEGGERLCRRPLLLMLNRKTHCFTMMTRSVLSVSKFSTDEEALSLANNTSLLNNLDK